MAVASGVRCSGITPETLVMEFCVKGDGSDGSVVVGALVDELQKDVDVNFSLGDTRCGTPIIGFFVC